MGRRPSGGKSLDGGGMASLAEFGFSGVPKARASAEGEGGSGSGDRRASGGRAGGTTTTTTTTVAPAGRNSWGGRTNNNRNSWGGHSRGIVPTPFNGAFVGAELASPNSLLLWFHSERAERIENALSEKLSDALLQPLYAIGRLHERRCSYKDLEEERKRRRDPARKDDRSLEPAPPVKAAIDSVAAMRCSRCTQDPENGEPGTIVAWLLQFNDTKETIEGYDKIARCLYECDLVNPEAPPFAANSHLKEWIPQATRSVLTNTKDLAKDDAVDDSMRKIPRRLALALFPFQEQGVRFGLKRHGRCLIGDQMGVGKTLQALALGSCYLDEGPLLVIAPKSMRLTWARELERWLPDLRPKNLLVCDSQAQATAPLKLFARAMRIRERLRAMGELNGEEDEVGGVTDAIQRMEDMETARKIVEQPRVVVVAYKMCQLLTTHIRSIQWGAVIVDESHTLRTTPKAWEGDDCESEQTASILRMLRGSKPEYAKKDRRETRGLAPVSARVILCSGTPSLTKPFDMYNQVDALHPGLLGDKNTFMHVYCDFKSDKFGNQNSRGGKRFAEYQVLLKNVMIRRLKSEVAADLPPKQREKVYVDVTKADMSEAWSELSEHRVNLEDDGVDCEGEPNSAGAIAKMQAIGLAKARGASEWIRDLLGIEQGGGDVTARDWRDMSEEQQKDHADSLQQMPKTVIFAHHRSVMDYVEDKVLRQMPRDWGDEKRLPYIRFDGGTSGEERDVGMELFRNDDNCRVALVSVTAGGVGIDFSRGSVVIFVELPLAHLVEQAEDRVHRQGVTDPVTVYYLVARGAGEWHDRKRLESIDLSLDTTRRALGDHDAADARGLDVRNRKSAKAEGDGDSLLDGDDLNVTDADDGDGDGDAPLDWSTRTDAHPAQFGEEEERSYVVPAPPNDLWFEYSGATQRVHLHEAPDGSAPLGQSFDPNDVLRAERRIRAELDPNSPDDVKRRRWSKPLDVRLSDAASDDCLVGGDKRSGFSRSFAPRLWGDVNAVFAAAAYVHELDALKAEDKNTISRVHACVRGGIKDYIHGKIDPIVTTQSKELGTGSTTRHGTGRRADIPEHAEWRPVLIRQVRGGEPRPAKEPVSLGWEDASLDGKKKTSIATGTPLCLKCMRPRDFANPLGEDALDLDLDLDVVERHVRAFTQAITQGPKLIDSMADLFCSEECAVEDRQSRSAGALREACHKRDRGVCAECGLDCHDLVSRIKVMRSQDARRAAILAAWPAMGNHGNGSRLNALVQKAASGYAWECDHVRAVYDGGGQCTVDNCQTLCVLCHKQRTRTQAKDRASRRKAEKLAANPGKKVKAAGSIRAGFAAAHLANCVDLTDLPEFVDTDNDTDDDVLGDDVLHIVSPSEETDAADDKADDKAPDRAELLIAKDSDALDSDSDSVVPETDDEADENIAPTQEFPVLPAKRKASSPIADDGEENI